MGPYGGRDPYPVAPPGHPGYVPSFDPPQCPATCNKPALASCVLDEGLSPADTTSSSRYERSVCIFPSLRRLISERYVPHSTSTMHASPFVDRTGRAHVVTVESWGTTLEANEVCLATGILEATRFHTKSHLLCRDVVGGWVGCNAREAYGSLIASLAEISTAMWGQPAQLWRSTRVGSPSDRAGGCDYRYVRR